MSDELVGTWIATTSAGDTEGFENFVKKMKVEDNLIEQFRKVTFGVTLSKQDGAWTASLLTDGKIVKTTSFESGKEYETQGMDKKMYKVVSKIDGGKNEETSIPTEGDGKGTMTTRVVKDGIMTVTTKSIEFPDCIMKYTMKKQ